jgi:hypothetical protein
MNDLTPKQKFSAILIAILAVFAVSCLSGSVLLMPVNFVVAIMVGLCGFFLTLLAITGYVSEFGDKD